MEVTDKMGRPRSVVPLVVLTFLTIGAMFLASRPFEFRPVETHGSAPYITSSRLMDIGPGATDDGLPGLKPTRLATHWVTPAVTNTPYGGRFPGIPSWFPPTPTP